MNPGIPTQQYAVQLVGPSQLRLTKNKEVFKPGPRQVLAKIEAVGLCFSDLKLLKQFSAHPRKQEIVTGLSKSVLVEIPSYVAGEKPTVPGHEATCRIVAVGSEVKHHKVGERCLIQTDYRDLRTPQSNAAFGYNFEGALQEYVLMDERVIMDRSTGKRFLIPVPERLSASAIALVEPWACVENSYATAQRQTLKARGKLLVVADAGHALEGLAEAVTAGRPATVTSLCATPAQRRELAGLGIASDEVSSLASLPTEEFDDIIYFGAGKQTLEALNDRLAAHGIINIVTGGRKIGQPVSVGVGRVHYGPTRWTGTTGSSAAEAYKRIPASGEIRRGDTVLVIGAGGPMGQMHVIRSLCAGVPGVTVTGTDVDDARLNSLLQKASGPSKANSVPLRLSNTQKTPLNEKFSYIALMAPVGALVAAAIRDSAEGALINIFAGIPAPTRHDLDLDTYLAKRCFMVGSSGSEIRDMEAVLQKVEAGQLDTDYSVDAVSGMAGAADGIAAVENRTLAGKIIVYPMLHDMGLVSLAQLKDKLPVVAARLHNGIWCKAAEDELLRDAR
ncbi:MAG: alcohol dehydrogenase catalytic domain-containing protein [Planctomycetota bacterium]|nr:alcohol dehydrogenase catalytic domain-containing protein [Planctomycetota bacterium]